MSDAFKAHPSLDSSIAEVLSLGWEYELRVDDALRYRSDDRIVSALHEATVTTNRGQSARCTSATPQEALARALHAMKAAIAA